MILELKLKNGEKCVMGGNFTFCVNANKVLSVRLTDDVHIHDVSLQDYPKYNVGGTFVYCEEAKDD